MACLYSLSFVEAITLFVVCVCVCVCVHGRVCVCVGVCGWVGGDAFK